MLLSGDFAISRVYQEIQTHWILHHGRITVRYQLGHRWYHVTHSRVLGTLRKSKLMRAVADSKRPLFFMTKKYYSTRDRGALFKKFWAFHTLSWHTEITCRKGKLLITWTQKSSKARKKIFTVNTFEPNNFFYRFSLQRIKPGCVITQTSHVSEKIDFF